MTVVYVCIAIAFFLQFATKIPVAVAMKRLPGGYDNRSPREQQAHLSGWGARALAAHQNAFEAFPGFAAGALVAVVGGADPARASILAVTFVIARCIYSVSYVAGWASVRSPVWLIGMLCSISLMLLPVLCHPICLR